MAEKFTNQNNPYTKNSMFNIIPDRRNTLFWTNIEEALAGILEDNIR